jgi:hypothetical protein
MTPVPASAIASDDKPAQPAHPTEPTGPKNPMNPTPALAGRLRAHLQALAASGATISYRDLAKAMLLSPPHTIHQVTEALEQLMAEDAATASPFIAAMVVSTWRGGLPAPGFFDCAARLGRFAGDATGPGARAFYAGEFDAAVALWAGRCPTADTT